LAAGPTHGNSKNSFAGSGLGGVIAIFTVFGTATIDHTTITGNTVSSGDNNVDGTFSK